MSYTAPLQALCETVVKDRNGRGLPTCADPQPDGKKLAALVEEVGEVARILQDDGPRWRLREELLDVACAAVLWAYAEDKLS